MKATVTWRSSRFGPFRETIFGDSLADVTAKLGRLWHMEIRTTCAAGHDVVGFEGKGVEGDHVEGTVKLERNVP